MRWRELKKPHADRLKELARLSPAELLQVPDNASPGEIRKAYLAKVRAYHPDSADPFVKAYFQEILKLINAAYELLRRDGAYG